MTFDRDTMEKIENEITLENYLTGNGVAEGELLKWKEKFGIKTSDIIIEDQVYYWDGYEFFNYSPFKEFKMFISKNQITNNLTDKLRICFYGFENIDNIDVEINHVNFSLNPKPYEYIELPVSSQKVSNVKITYNNTVIDLTEKFNKIIMNQIYYRINDTQKIL